MTLSWQVLGVVGMWCMETSYGPQIVRLWRRKHADDISLLFPSMNLFGRLCAMIYAAQMGSMVFAAGFLVGWLIRLTFLGQVIWYRRKAIAAEAVGATLPVSASRCDERSVSMPMLASGGPS